MSPKVIMQCTEIIKQSNLNFGLSREINDAVAKIKAIVATLSE